MLDLFILENCPYCQKVQKFMDEHGIKYKTTTILDKSSEEALIRIGGKRQVPFLIDNERNVQIYESDDIIEYLKTI